jgi:4-hydroxybenzoate polyprenyltransferase
VPAQLQLAIPLPPVTSRTLLSCVRWREVLVLQGTPLMGMIFAIGPFTIRSVLTALLLSVAGFFLVAHIWTLNDWADGWADDLDPHKTGRAFLGKGVAGGKLLSLSLLFLAVALGLFVLLPYRTLLLALMVAVLGVLYSYPGIGLKRLPLASAAVHLAGGAFHFLLGFSALSPVGPRAIVISGFFALVFAGGHSTQEVQDWSSDRKNGTRTAAVTFGPRRVFGASAALFGLAYLYLFVLGVSGWVPLRLAVIVIPLLPLQAIWFLRTYRSGLAYRQVNALRERYRLLFAAVGLGILSILFV